MTATLPNTAGVPNGLAGFKAMSVDPHNSRVLRVRFSERVTRLHQKQLLDAIYAWILSQKFLMDNGGRPLTADEAMAALAMHKAAQASTQQEEQGTNG